MGFSVMNMINSVAEERNYIVENIEIDLIEVNENNFYNVNDTEELKESIEAIGLQHNITVIKNGLFYRIVSGHRRFKAYEELVKENRIDKKTIPCRVVEMTEHEERIALIISNSTSRELTSFEKMKQVAELKRIAIEIKENDDKAISGKLRDFVANTLNMSSSEVARYEAIENNLSEGLKEEFKNNEINTSVAYEASKLDKEYQEEFKKTISDKKGQGEKVKADDVKKIIASSEEIDDEAIYDVNNNEAICYANDDEPIYDVNSGVSKLDITESERKIIIEMQSAETVFKRTIIKYKKRVSNDLFTGRKEYDEENKMIIEALTYYGKNVLGIDE